MNASDNENAHEFGEVKHSKVVELNQKLKRKIAEVKRLENQYETTLKEAVIAEDVLESASPEQWSERNHTEIRGGCSKLLNTLRKMEY